MKVPKHKQRLILGTLAFLLLLGWGLGLCNADTPGSAGPSPQGEINVGVTEMPPFTMKGTNGQWEGLSVELWKEAATHLGWKYRLQEFTYSDLLEAVVTGKVDIALSPYPMTLENEERADFTHSYYSSGLCVAVAHQTESPWKALASDLFSGQFLGWTVGIVAVLITVGTAVWFVERKSNEAHFGNEPRVGIGDGIWWAAVTITTVGYGDKVPQTRAGKALAVVWLFCGIFLLAAFTGHVSSALTLQKLGSPIQAPQDLHNFRMGVVVQSAGSEYLRNHHIRSKDYANDDLALRAVQKGEIIGLVASEPILRYRFRQEQSNRFDVLPFTLDRRDYAFVVSNGSPLRERLNREVLQIRAQPGWQDLLFKYLEE